MTAKNQRDWVSKAYSSVSWKAKVKNMTDAQVTAVYLSFQRRGKV